MEWVNLLISLVGGILGGMIGGAVLPHGKELKILGHIFCGVFGGVAGNYIVQLLGIISSAGILGPEATAAAPALDSVSILANGGISAVCGAILTAVVGWIKSNLQPTA